MIAALCLGLLVLSSRPAAAQLFVAVLNGASEATPNGSPGFGNALVTLTANTMRVQIIFASLVAPNTAAHIHSETPLPLSGVAGVATPTPTFPGFPTGTTSGSYDQTFDMTLASSYNPAYITSHGGTPTSARDALFAGIQAGRAYVNIHSGTFPQGEIRGFLVPAAAVPEPGTVALALSGLLPMAGIVIRRRRQR